MKDDQPFGPYLTEKIKIHVGAILIDYIDAPDEIGVAVYEIIKALEEEIIWARPA